MTLNDLLEDVRRRCGYVTGASADATTTTRLTAFLNETQQEILSEPGMETLLEDTLTFASVASTPEYSLPQTIAKITGIRQIANRRTLDPKSHAWYLDAYPDPTAVTGIPDSWVELGFSPVASQPSAAAELFVKSDSATDGASKSAYLECYTTGGYFHATSAVMNGTTAVSFGYTDIVAVTKFYIDKAGFPTTTAAGNVKLLEGSGAGTELARIQVNQNYSRYKRIALAICPSSAITYYVDFERDVTDLSVANDIPALPARFHRLLAVGARMREYEKQDQMGRYQAAASEYGLGMRKLKYWLATQAAGSPNLRGPMPRGSQVSQLGGWFPAGS